MSSRLARLWPEDLQPKLIAVLREGLTREDVTRDVLAGVVVGIVALPLAIAFAIASGVRPEQGLYTAIVAGFLISLLSGSRVQIGGPTGAFVVLVFSIGVFRGLLRGPRSDVLVLLTTFGLTVLVDLVVAIEVGVVLAALLFMRRMGEVSTIRSITDQMADEERPGFDAENVGLVLPERTEVFEVAGSFFFGSAQRFSEVLSELRTRPRLVILRMRSVFALDSTGLHALEKVHERLKRHGTHLILSGVHAQPMDVLVRSGAYERMGEDNVCGSFREAVVRAWVLLDEPGGSGATARSGVSSA